MHLFERISPIRRVTLFGAIQLLTRLLNQIVVAVFFHDYSSPSVSLGAGASVIA